MSPFTGGAWVLGQDAHCPTECSSRRCIVSSQCARRWQAGAVRLGRRPRCACHALVKVRGLGGSILWPNNAKLVGLEWVWGLLQPGFIRWAPASQNHLNHWCHDSPIGVSGAMSSTWTAVYRAGHTAADLVILCDCRVSSISSNNFPPRRNRTSTRWRACGLMAWTISML